MSKTSQMTFVGFLLAVSTLSISAIQANASTLVDDNKNHTVSNVENRLSRLTNAMQQRGINSSTSFAPEEQIVAGFANRSGGGGFVNRYRGGFANRSGGGGFANRSPWRNGGGFYNRY